MAVRQNGFDLYGENADSPSLSRSTSSLSTPSFDNTTRRRTNRAGTTGLERQDSPTGNTDTVTSLSRRASSFNLFTSDLPDPHAFADRLTNEYSLTPLESAKVHEMVEFGNNLDQGDLLLRMSSKADRIDLRKTFQRMIQESSETITQNIHTKMLEMAEQKWELTKDQVGVITSVAKEVMFDPLHTHYLSISDRVETILQAKPNSYGLEDVIGVPVRMIALRKAVVYRCKTSRNQFRIAIRDTVHGKKRLTLDKAVKFYAGKFRMPGGTKLTYDHDVRCAILRRLARENKELLMSSKNEPEEDEAEEEGLDSQEESGSEQEDSNANRRGKRGAVTKKNGKTSKRPKIQLQSSGKTWWHFVDDFFSEKVENWGTELDKNGWLEYIRETMQFENIMNGGQSQNRRQRFGSLVSAGAAERTGLSADISNILNAPVTYRVPQSLPPILNDDYNGGLYGGVDESDHIQRPVALRINRPPSTVARNAHQEKSTPRTPPGQMARSRDTGSTTDNDERENDGHHGSVARRNENRLLPPILPSGAAGIAPHSNTHPPIPPAPARALHSVSRNAYGQFLNPSPDNPSRSYTPPIGGLAQGGSADWDVGRQGHRDGASPHTPLNQAAWQGGTYHGHQQDHFNSTAGAGAQGAYYGGGGYN